MSKLASLAFAGSVGLGALTISRDAAACRNEATGRSERIVISEPEGEPAWSRGRAHDDETGWGRAEALLHPSHTSWTPGPVTVELDGPDEDSTDVYEHVGPTPPPSVREAVLKLRRAKRKARRRALALRDVFTVEIHPLADRKL